MRSETLKTLKILAPNVKWNTYELIKKTPLIGREFYHIRVKDKYGEYAKEERLIHMNDWKVIECEIGLINWLLKEYISKKDLETIKSSIFKVHEKDYLYKDTLSLISILNPNDQIQKLVKKHWALDLWGWYNNNYRLTGVGAFMYYTSCTYRKVGGGYLSNINIHGESYEKIESEGPQWEWPKEFGILY